MPCGKLERGDYLDFRPFHTRETQELIDMVMALYAEDPEGEVMTPEKVRRTVEHLAFRPDKGEIILIQDGARYCGYSIVLFLWSNELDGDIIVVDELYVRPQFRSRGLGRSFFGWLESRFPEAKAVELETTPANTRARELYQKLGFAETENVRMRKSSK